MQMMTRGLSAALVLLATAATAAPYPAMAPAAQYMSPDKAGEIAQARSAAPAALSDEAEILTLGPTGYETAVPGTNGFVCLVQRSWFSGLEDAEFWNPKERAPICVNPQAARSVLPGLLKRTQWALAGVTREDMIARTRALIAANQYVMPETGAMSYMMARNAYLNDDAHGGWHPHVMLWLPHVSARDWGVGSPGAPVMAAQDSIEPVTLFFVPVAKWSDGEVDGMHM